MRRFQAAEFVILAAKRVDVDPVVKYAALSLYADRFAASLERGVAKVGELINFHACTDIMDLLYEKEETSRLYLSPVALAASVLVCSYIITVPKQSWNFLYFLRGVLNGRSS